MKEIIINTDVLQIETLKDTFFEPRNIQIDMLRLDLIHPQISGNKWFKLKYNLQEAIEQKATSIVSFGGAYSNHLHALAYAGHLLNIKTIGIIRGDIIDNDTLNDCKNWGMQLHFISRSEYRNKIEIDFVESMQKKFRDSLIIPDSYRISVKLISLIEATYWS